MRHIAELEFAKVDLAIGPGSPHVRLDEVGDDPAAVIQKVRQGPTIGFAAITLRVPGRLPTEGEIRSTAHLAQQLAAPVLVLEAAPSGSSIAQEVERLTALERIISLSGAILTLTTKTGTLTEDPNIAVELCTSVSGIGLTLDPSHFICGPHQGKPFDAVYPFVRHAHLRDTGRRMDQLQVKVGRGEIEYGRVVNSLQRYEFKGALAVAIEDQPPTDMDVEAEVRKLRLLLESLI